MFPVNLDGVRFPRVLYVYILEFSFKAIVSIVSFAFTNC